MPTLIETTAAIRAARTRFRAAQHALDEAQCDVAQARPRSRSASVEVEHRYLKASWAHREAERIMSEARDEWHALIAEASKRRMLQ